MNSALPHLRNGNISPDDLLQLPWLKHGEIYQIFAKSARAKVSISLSIDSLTLQKSQLDDVTTTQTLPRSSKHLQKLLEKFVSDTSDIVEKAQFDFLLKLEQDKLSKKLASKRADLANNGRKFQENLVDFLKRLDVGYQIPWSVDYDPIHEATILRIYQDICESIHASFIQRQQIHNEARLLREKKRAELATRESEILTLTKRDLDRHIMRLLSEKKNLKKAQPGPFPKNYGGRPQLRTATAAAAFVPASSRRQPPPPRRRPDTGATRQGQAGQQRRRQPPAAATNPRRRSPPTTAIQFAQPAQQRNRGNAREN